MLDITPTIERFREVLEWEPTAYTDRAFRAMFLNRTSDSRASGLRPLGGWKQNGDMRVHKRYRYHRFSARMLERRLLLKGRTMVTGDDFRVVLDAAAITPRSFIYCDPVYPEVGNKLYHNTPKWVDWDHVALRDKLLAMDNRWALSYNDHSLIRFLYSGCEFHPVRMPKSSQGGEKIELLITPKETLGWQEQEIPTGAKSSL